jgi:hypothetical protein
MESGIEIEVLESVPVAVDQALHSRQGAIMRVTDYQHFVIPL